MTGSHAWGLGENMVPIVKLSLSTINPLFVYLFACFFHPQHWGTWPWVPQSNLTIPAHPPPPLTWWQTISPYQWHLIHTVTRLSKNFSPCNARGRTTAVSRRFYQLEYSTTEWRFLWHREDLFDKSQTFLMYSKDILNRKVKHLERCVQSSCWAYTVGIIHSICTTYMWK